MIPLIVAGIGTALGKVFNSGIEQLAKTTLRLVLLVVFSALVILVIDYFLGKIKSYSFNSFDPCTLYFMDIIGFFPAINIFLQILAVGFLAKYLIAYMSDSL